MIECLNKNNSFFFKMDPNSRPTFEELAIQLEQMMLRQHGQNSTDVPADATVVMTDVPSTCLSSGSADASECAPIEAKGPQPSSKFDRDVYLVPGSSPSEKARCHYLQGRSAKEKPVK